MTHETPDRPLPEVVRDLFFDRADGVLTVSVPPARCEVFFAVGNVFYCKSDAPEQRLDRILVRWGLVPEHAVGGLVQRAGRDVRGALVREGVFPDAAAFDAFMGQVLRERIMELFAAPQAAFEFRAEDVRSLSSLPFHATTPNLVLEGVRRLGAGKRWLQPLVDDDPCLVLNDRPLVPVESLQMGPAEGYVLSQVTGTTPLSAACAVSPLGPEQTVRLLYALLILDVARHPAFVGYRFHVGELERRNVAEREQEGQEKETIAAEYRRVRAADLFQVVPDAAGLPPDDLREVIRAYTERWKPERFGEKVAKHMREELVLIAGRAGEALLVMMDAARRRAAPERAPAEGEHLTAEDAFRLKRLEFSKSETQTEIDRLEAAAGEYTRRAQEAMRKKDFHTAIQMARESVRLHETAAAQAILAEALAQNPHWAKKAEEAYLRAMQLDQFNAALPMALGRIYARHGLKERAKEQFQRTLEIQSDHAEAKAALKELKRG